LFHQKALITKSKTQTTKHPAETLKSSRVFYFLIMDEWK
jgi:hypothetical protein